MSLTLKGYIADSVPGLAFPPIWSVIGLLSYALAFTGQDKDEIEHYVPFIASMGPI
jgi:CRISPR/Cas system-associated protein Cas5 (RAMP superfamily)